MVFCAKLKNVTVMFHCAFHDCDCDFAVTSFCLVFQICLPCVWFWESWHFTQFLLSIAQSVQHGQNADSIARSHFRRHVSNAVLSLSLWKSSLTSSREIKIFITTGEKKCERNSFANIGDSWAAVEDGFTKRWRVRRQQQRWQCSTSDSNSLVHNTQHSGAVTTVLNIRQ